MRSTGILHCLSYDINLTLRLIFRSALVRKLPLVSVVLGMAVVSSDRGLFACCVHLSGADNVGVEVIGAVWGCVDGGLGVGVVGRA